MLLHHYNTALCIRVRSQPPVNCFPGYIYNFASTASKKLSESVAETAQNLKKSVEEGKINGIIDKVYTAWFCLWNLFSLLFNLNRLNEILFVPTQTILGDFQKEQQRFVEEKKAKQSGN